MSLLHPSRPSPQAPRLQALTPQASIPGGSFDLSGQRLLPSGESAAVSEAFFGEVPAALDLLRSSRARVRVPGGAIAGEFTLRSAGLSSNALHANVAVPMAEDLHLVSNPAMDADGNLFAMVSGPRGERVPVSVFRIDRDFQVRPFVHDLLNISALAFDKVGYLYASSRSEGTVYRVSPEGAVSTFAEGMGIATGLAFDREGNLFVGDRSGTIFKLGPYGSRNAGEIFVFATLEPSVAAYHLAFRDDGTLLVTAPSTSSHQGIYAISPEGETSVLYRGLGRPQGMALDVEGNLYVAASLRGERGIVRLWQSAASGAMEAELCVSGNDLVGLCFLEDGCVALATHATIFHADLGITGRSLV